MEFVWSCWLSTYRIGFACWFSLPELTWVRSPGNVYEWEVIRTAAVIGILEWIRHNGMRCTAWACDPMSQFWLVEGEITITQCTVDVLFVKLQASRWYIVLKWQIITSSDFFSLTSTPVHLFAFHRVEWALLPTASSEDEGSNAEGKFHILRDCNIQFDFNF